MDSRIVKTSLAAALAALTLPVAADAASVVYSDGGNIYLESPDGSRGETITTDGSAQSPYRLPSADDAGNVVAVQGGNSSSKVIAHVSTSGTVTKNVMPWQVTGWTNIGPNAARLSPTGGKLAYTYFKNHGPYSGYPNGGFEARMAIVPATAPGSPTSPMIDQPGWEAPTWIDGKLVVAKNGALHLETEPLQFVQFLSATGYSMLRGEVSRDKSRYLVHLRNQQTNVSGLVLYAHTGAFPGGQVTEGCEIPSVGEVDRTAGLSPDGTQVTWADDQGVKVGTFTPGQRTQGGFCTGSVVTLSPTGEEPAFSQYTVPLPPPPAPEPKPTPTPTPTPAPTPSPAPAPAPKPAPVPAKPGVLTPNPTTSPNVAPTTGDQELAVVAPKATTSQTVVRGLRIKATAPAAGTLSVSVRAAGKALATGRKSTTKAAQLTIPLKATKAGRKALKKLKGRAVTLVVTFTPAGPGAKLTSSARVTLR